MRKILPFGIFLVLLALPLAAEAQASPWREPRPRTQPVDCTAPDPEMAADGLRRAADGLRRAEAELERAKLRSLELQAQAEYARQQAAQALDPIALGRTYGRLLLLLTPPVAAFALWDLLRRRQLAALAARAARQAGRR